MSGSSESYTPKHLAKRMPVTCWLKDRPTPVNVQSHWGEWVAKQKTEKALAAVSVQSEILVATEEQSDQGATELLECPSETAPPSGIKVYSQSTQVIESSVEPVNGGGKPLRIIFPNM